MTPQETISYLRSVIEHVLIASEDGGTMNDIDWDLLRTALLQTEAFATEREKLLTAALEKIADYPVNVDGYNNTSAVRMRFAACKTIARNALKGEETVFYTNQSTQGGK
tara:strand:- start:17384 stop:17710 length:327 start_codon:yes stop_codon:yes gene_type:complete